jgi:cytochrome P450
MKRHYPPGPRDRLLGLTFYPPMLTNPFGFVTRVAREYGDFAFVRMAWVRLYLVNRPELIREVLVTKVKSFRKLERQMRALRKIEGDGLVASDGAVWTRHRPVVQGSFHGRHFEGYADLMVEYTRRRLTRWPQKAEAFDIAEDMNELALEIIARIVFDVDVIGEATRLRDAIHRVRVEMQREISCPVVLPDWLPLPSKFRQRRALREVDDFIWDLIRERKASNVVKNDMLAQMLAASAAKHAAAPLTDAEIRDEASTLFVAGHDTTSAALAWFWYVLAQYPDVQDRVVQEVDSILGRRTATAQDWAQLKYLDMVVKESMRLYPAAGFLFGREAVEDVELDGYTLRRGSWVFISPYVVHRDARNFPDPEKFDPERFAPNRIDDIPSYAYIPFGAGPRVCIGNNMATMQIVLTAATVLQSYRIAPAQPAPDLELEIVLRPRGGLRVVAEPREGRGAEAISA